ncbi:MAG: hypothetical protein ABSB59_43995 [Streptosporangiaceae bacterium]
METDQLLVERGPVGVYHRGVGKNLKQRSKWRVAATAGGLELNQAAAAISQQGDPVDLADGVGSAGLERNLVGDYTERVATWAHQPPTPSAPGRQRKHQMLLDAVRGCARGGDGVVTADKVGAVSVRPAGRDRPVVLVGGGNRVRIEGPYDVSKPGRTVDL